MRGGKAVRTRQHEKPENYDLGNNFIRKGSGLARTPPRFSEEESKSYETSPVERVPQPNIEVMRPFKDPTPVQHLTDIETEPSPISWPSRQE